MSVIEAGRMEGPALLLLHGLTDSAATWAAIAQHWLRDCRVVAVDLRGHGKSPRFSEEEIRTDPAESMVSDVVSVARHLATSHGPVDVVGHSLGGVLALAAAVRVPEVFLRLVLEDPAPADGDWLPGVKEPFLREQIAMLDAFEKADPAWPRPLDKRWAAEELGPLLGAKSLVDRRLITSGHLTPGGHLADMVDSLRVPTLMLLADSSHLDETLPTPSNPLVTLEVVPGAGHCIHRDEPAQFHALVDAWLG